MSAEDRATLLTADGAGKQAKAAALQRLTAPACGADCIPVLCADVARLCDILRGERAYLALCCIYPSSKPGADARVREAQLREENCLYLLREKRAELVNAVEALAS